MLNFILYILFTFSGDNRGLQLAYGEDKDHLTQMGGSVVTSDYGPWGREKKMYDPVLTKADGLWNLQFNVHENGDVIAKCYSPDLLHWKPQDYFKRSTVNGLQSTEYVTGIVNGKERKGQIWEVENGMIDKLKHHFDSVADNQKRWRETLDNDKEKYSNLKDFSATLSVSNRTKKISDKLIGIFFEDISYAADGGLYGELIQNRDFEYSKADRSRNKDWDHHYGWNNVGEIATDNPLSENNKFYLKVNGQRSTINGKVGVELIENGKVIAKTKINVEGKEWKRYKATVKASDNADKAELHIIIGGDTVKNYGWDGICLDKGEKYDFSMYANVNDGLNMDIISLFPENTYKGHGMRKDLAETIAALSPKFMRFPGGCMAHGDRFDNMYHWKESIGEWKDRKGARNIWSYHQTRGLGYYEFFQFCEDMEAEPLPVLAAGVTCQNSDPTETGLAGQQGGLPFASSKEQGMTMEQYVQDVLDLIDWANGDPATNKWAKMRADAGHPAPFNLKYIGIGNEDLISDVFTERYLMICKAVREKHPEIQICGTVGPFHKGSSDYEWGWKIANENRDIIDMVDEHYYESPGWFLNNQDYYDNYDRNAAKVYLGEYASHPRSRKNTLEAALTEAIHLCNVERNADVVMMTSYAPLLSKNGHSNWNPDMIYFDNRNIYLTPTYEVQKMFSNSSGDEYVYSELKADGSTQDFDIKKRLVSSVVRDSKTGKEYIKIVNALPVNVKVRLDGTKLSGHKAEYLSGQINDQNVERKVKEIADGTVTLEPYSLTVID